jgi:hypothetical protein
MLWGHILSATSATVTVTGTAVDLVYTPATGAYTLDAVSGAFAVTGTAATLVRSRVMAAESGVITVTGTAASFVRSTIMAATSGAVTITGTDADLLYGTLVPVSTIGAGLLAAAQQRSRDRLDWQLQQEALQSRHTETLRPSVTRPPRKPKPLIEARPLPEVAIFDVTPWRPDSDATEVLGLLARIAPARAPAYDVEIEEMQELMAVLALVESQATF